MGSNPFPGPQPYRATDRDRFFGRSDMAHKLRGSILATRCITVHGPSGAGKSSLMQAAVLPMLVDKNDARVIRVDSWPEGEEPTKWLAGAVSSELDIHGVPEDEPARETVFKAARSAARASSRPLVLYLDQLEQLLFAGRTIEETQPFFDCVEELVDMPLRTVRVVLSLREDYLGRFRDRLRDMRRMTESGFRVGPLNVAELTDAMVQAAAAGDPPQEWSVDEMRSLMMQVRLPGQAATDEAEAQSAYAQIICRALFQERAAGKTMDATEAEPILRGYLESTVASLGELRKQAEQLLEDHLVGADGSRTLRTEKELARVLAPADLAVILKQLEGAAILRAEEHHGSRYFEIGHDWLARKVFEQRAERERLAEQKRIEEEQARQLAQARAQQRKLRAIAGGSVAITALVGAAAIVALIARSQAVAAQKQADVARTAAEAAETKAKWERDEADDLRIMAGYLALQSQGDLAGAMKLLGEVKKPQERSGWVEYANTALEKNALFATLRGHRAALRTAVFSPDGKYVLTASDDFTARVWNADGTGQPLVLTGHRGVLTSAAFAPDSKDDSLRILTTSADGTARVWSIKGSEATSIELAGKTTEAVAGAWSPDGKQVVAAYLVVESNQPPRPAKESFVVRTYSATKPEVVGESTDQRGLVNAVVFLDNTHVILAAEDKTVRIWDGVTKGKIVQVPGITVPVSFVAVNRERGLVVMASADTRVQIFKVGANATLAPYATLEGHAREVLHAAISDDGKFVATASADRTARVWNVEQAPAKGKEVVLDKHDGPVNHVAFRPGSANVLATASSDLRARLFRLETPNEPFVLTGHGAPVKSIAWNPSGDRVVTAALDTHQSASADHAARIFDTQALEGTTPWTLEGIPQVAAIGANGKTFMAAFDDKSVKLFLERKSSTPITINAKSTESWGIVSAVAAASGGAKVALASMGKEALGETVLASVDARAKPIRALHIYAESNWTEPAKQYEVESVIRHLEWDATGRRVVAALENSTAMVFPSEGGGSPIVLQGHTNWLTSASFSGDGNKVVTTSMDRKAMVFDAQGKGAPLDQFEHPGVVYAATFDPPGQRIATACADGKVRIFELGKKAAIAEFDAKNGLLHKITWSRDGSRIAVATLSGAIVVWSHLSWPLAQEPRPSVLQTASPALALGFVEESNTLLAVAANRTHAWKLETGQLKADLEARNRDCLGVDNRMLYLNEAPSVAAAAFVRCEQAQRHVVSTESAGPIDPANLLVARLVVWPATAEVEMDGVRFRRRDPFVELWGKAGEKKKVRVIDGTSSSEVEVTIEPSGAKPAVITVERGLSSGRDNARELQLGEGDFDALTPDQFQ